MLQPLWFQPGKFLSMGVVEREQSLIQCSGPRYFISDETTGSNFRSLMRPAPSDLFVPDALAGHGGLGGIGEFTHPNPAAEAAELK
jgi:hypothetical protein